MTDAASRSVRQAQAEYFERNGFAADGGYGQRWVGLKFGPVTIPLYNSQARRRAVPLHDLHHLATGYGTDPKGEAQMATWELAAGTHDKWFALFINLPALLYGMLIWPRATLQAWRAGRDSDSLYRYDYEDWLLDLSVAELKALTSPKSQRV